MLSSLASALPSVVSMPRKPKPPSAKSMMLLKAPATGDATVVPAGLDTPAFSANAPVVAMMPAASRTETTFFTWMTSLNMFLPRTWFLGVTIATLPADMPSGKQETRAVIPAIFAPDFPFPFCFIISQNYTVSQPVNQLFQQIFSTFFAKISSENVFEGINSPIKHSFKQVRSCLHCCRPALRANFVVFIRFSEGSP